MGSGEIQWVVLELSPRARSVTQSYHPAYQQQCSGFWKLADKERGHHQLPRCPCASEKVSMCKLCPAAWLGRMLADPALLVPSQAPAQ